MAFGFGFNKQKVLSAAEKFVQQGKLPNAIVEYEKVLKADPKDLTVMNTVGDLYSRLGNIDKAVDCFKSVGDAYASQGFTVKAIAMYKKLSKIKHSFEGVLRLAELYTQQGLFNDARAQYLQVAEEFLRSGELEQAVRIFQKTLEMDPDNVVMRSKLAEVYVRLGKKAEAWQIFTAAAETLRARGQLEGAETILQRMLTLDPENSYALLMRGRTALDSGDVNGAIEFLEKVADLDSHPEGLTALFNAYLQSGRLPEARVLAGKLLTVHNDPSAVNRYAEALIVSGQFDEALQVYAEYSDSLLSSDPTRILESLRTLIGHVRDNTQSLEIVLALFTKAGETSHTTEVYELLAHAYVQSGDLEKAREFYLKLTQLEPQNQLHARNYQQIIEKVGGSTPKFISAEEGSILIEELETTAPFVDQRYEDEVALAVRAALTDAELFISYNMPEKAMGPLLSVLPKAPQDLRLNQRLAALHNRAERFAQAAICCRTLETIYHDAGFPEEATRYGELAARYEERASAAEVAAEVKGKVEQGFAISDAVIAEHISPPAQSTAVHGLESHNAATSIPTAVRTGPFFHKTAIASASAKATSPEAGQEFDIRPSEAASTEIDLSSEWDGAAPDEISQMPLPETSLDPAAETALHHDPIHVSEAPVADLHAAGIDAVDLHPVESALVELTPETSISNAATDEPAGPDPAVVAELVEEIRFYLGHSLVDLAQGALAKLGQVHPDPAVIAALHQEIEDATRALAIQAAASESSSFESISVEQTDGYESGSEVPAALVAELQIPTEVPAPAHVPVLDSLVSSHESSLENGFQQLTEIPQSAEEHHESGAETEHLIEAGIPDFATAPVTNIPEAIAQPEAIVPEYFEAPPVPVQSMDALGSIVSDLEASLGDSFLAEKAGAPVEHTASAIHSEPASHPSEIPVAAVTSAPPVAAMAAAAPGSSTAAWQHSTAFTNFKPPTAVPPPAVQDAPAAKAKLDRAGIDLADMFGELKHELEEDAANSDEDPETHYSLGVAFREMGLLDEAIGELQKVCQTVEHGHPFAQILQTYTWLAQCFLDKGIPEAALRWYERALALPALDADTRLALHYELACAYETAGSKSSALSHFMEVYGNNIDYRDVAERIKALKS